MASNPNYCDITPEIEALAAQSLQNSSIDAGDYVRYDVKRGLRDLNGKGVLAGLTEISDIIAKKMVDGQEIPCDGKLYYRGIDVEKHSLYIHAPQPELSTAENILSLLRPDSSYSFWEAHVLDICLTLHAEHGGGNNSTFTTHVVTSSGTDTYSCMAAALASLKGPKHGGANIKVIRMFEDMKEQVKDWKDEDEVRHYLQALLDKQAFDRAGLIYGMGHAVYSLSDPRANLLHSFVEKLSREKGRTEEYELYSLVERLGPEIIAGERKMYKGVSANVDFYSGFVYHMLDLPLELYTPLFAMARVAGWSAHRIEELINMGKIIRPAYKYVGTHADYAPLAER